MPQAFGDLKVGDRVRVLVEADVTGIGQRPNEGVHFETGDNWFYVDQPSLQKVQRIPPPPFPERTVIFFSCDESNGTTYTLTQGKLRANDASQAEPYADTAYALQNEPYTILFNPEDYA